MLPSRMATWRLWSTGGLQSARPSKYISLRALNADSEAEDNIGIKYSVYIRI